MEANTSLSIKEIITQLGDSNKPLLGSKLADLSDLNQGELGFLDRVWQTVEPKRRRQIMERLVELAEDNFELNFDGIFISRLKDQDEEVRSKAIEGLWENEEPSLIEPLVNLLEQDSSEKVQAAAATALGKFAMLAEHQKLRLGYVSRIRRALLTAISDKSKVAEVRRRALEAAAPLSLPQVRQAIMEAYQSDNKRLKVSAVYAMGKNCDPSWLAILLKELASTNPEVRYEAAAACGELGEDKAVPYLIQLIDDTDTDVQLAAIQALGKIGGSEAKESLRQCLKSPSEAIRQATEEALHELEVMGEPLSPELKPWSLYDYRQ